MFDWSHEACTFWRMHQTLDGTSRRGQVQEKKVEEMLSEWSMDVGTGCGCGVDEIVTSPIIPEGLYW